MVASWFGARWLGGAAATSESHALVSACRAGSRQRARTCWCGWLRKVLLGWRLHFLGLHWCAVVGRFDLPNLLCSTSRHGRKIFGKAQIVSAAFMAYSHAATTDRNSLAFLHWLSSSGPFAYLRHSGWSSDCALTMVWARLSAAGDRAHHGSAPHQTAAMDGFCAERSGTHYRLASRSEFPQHTHTISMAIMVWHTRRFSACAGVGREIVTAWSLPPSLRFIAWSVASLLAVSSRSALYFHAALPR